MPSTKYLAVNTMVIYRPTQSYAQNESNGDYNTQESGKINESQNYLKMINEAIRKVEITCCVIRNIRKHVHEEMAVVS